MTVKFWIEYTGQTDTALAGNVVGSLQELVRAQKNVERFFAEEKNTTEKTQTH